MHAAAFRGHTAVCSLLIEEGAFVDATDDEKMTPLHLAAINGHAEVLSILLSTGPPVDALDKRDKTPLCCTY